MAESAFSDYEIEFGDGDVGIQSARVQRMPLTGRVLKTRTETQSDQYGDPSTGDDLHLPSIAESPLPEHAVKSVHSVWTRRCAQIGSYTVFRGDGSLEQLVPLSLQVAMSFQRVLK